MNASLQPGFADADTRAQPGTFVLSLFPGIGMLDMAFEEAGFCVVRGPDLIFGGDVRRFNPPLGKFDGVIGGPPCQLYGGLANFAHRWNVQPEHLIPEFERCVAEAQPAWWLMENVRNAPIPSVPGYVVRHMLLNNRWLGEVQSRMRRFSYGTPGGQVLDIETEVFEPIEFKQSVTSANAGQRKVHAKKTGGTIAHYPLEEALELQGLPPDFFGPSSPFTPRAKRKVVAQGVPLPMGRAIAAAIKSAMYAPKRRFVGKGHLEETGYIDSQGDGPAE